MIEFFAAGFLGLLFGSTPPGKKTLYGRDKFVGSKGSKFYSNEVMKEMMKDPEIRAVLQDPREQQQLFKELYKRGRDTTGVTVDDMREALGVIRNDRKGSIDVLESERLAKRLVPNSYEGKERFITPPPDDALSSSSDKKSTPSF